VSVWAAPVCFWLVWFGNHRVPQFWQETAPTRAQTTKGRAWEMATVWQVLGLYVCWQTQLLCLFRFG